MTFKPTNYTSVSPYLIVDGARGTIDFLKQVFDAEELRTFAADNGGLMHAELRIDDSVVMLADKAPDWPPNPSSVHIYVRDVDETYRRALAAGAESVQAPIKKDDADKRGGVMLMAVAFIGASRVSAGTINDAGLELLGITEAEYEMARDKAAEAYNNELAAMGWISAEEAAAAR